MNSRYFLIIAYTLCIGSFSLVPSFAEGPSCYYVACDRLDPTLLPAPPAPQSVDESKQIALVVATQRTINQYTRLAVKHEQHVRLDFLTSILDHPPDPTHSPKLMALLNNVLNDTEIVTEADKHYWHTKRPYLVSKSVKLLVDPIDQSPGYPSGHTSEMRVLAEVLSLIYPDQREKLRDRAELIAWHRVEAGVHTPFDLEGGRLLAMMIMGALIQNKDFQEDLEGAKEEVSTKSE